jgi:hypothetical protein
MQSECNSPSDKLPIEISELHLILEQEGAASLSQLRDTFSNLGHFVE